MKITDNIKKLDSTLVRLEERDPVGMAAVERIGRLLANLLFPPRIRDHLNEARTKASGQTIRINLKIDDSSIAKYPWEALYIDDRYIATSNALITLELYILITLQQFYSALSSVPGRSIVIGENQHKIVEHKYGPLWVIARPGSGKTESIVLLCLKLLLVDGVDPRSIMITTFTEKAARNLTDRLVNYKTHLASLFPELNEIDLFQLRVGTVYSLCKSIMLEYRYPEYKNYRPLDDIDQLLFIYFHCPLASKGESRMTPEEIL